MAGKEWFSASELAGLPGMTKSVTRITERAKKELWFNRKREGRGGGLEYKLFSLPEETRAAIAAQAVSEELKEISEKQTQIRAQQDLAATETKANAIAETLNSEEKARIEAILKKKQEGRKLFDLLPAWKQKKANAKFELMRACIRFIRKGDLGKTHGEELFITSLQLNQVEIPAWVREEIDTLRVHISSLRRWFAEEEEGGIYALVDHYGTRRNTGKIDANPQIQKVILAMIQKSPHVKARLIHQYLKKEFPDLSNLCERSIDRWAMRWKENNPQEYMMMTNPDAWKSNYKMAVGKYDENITALNQLWEMDSTPADVMLTNGRHSVLGVIDVYSRRAKLLVSKSSKATMVATLIRRAIMDWGFPQAIRTDNGQDYVSNHLQRIIRDLGIEQVLCTPFASEEKPFIERFFGTFSGDLLEVTPGFIGHNVAERKSIEAQKSFAKRLATPGEVIGASLNSAELQELCDKWCKFRYEFEPHAGLKGMAPFQMVKDWKGEIRRLEDESILHVLLAEAPGNNGVREIRKKGIQVENAYFMDIEGTLGIYAGHQAQVLLDPDDYGKIWVFLIQEDGSKKFLCEAVNLDRTDILEQKKVSRQEIAQKTKAKQHEHLMEKLREHKEYCKLLKKNIGKALLDGDEARNGMLIAFPRPGVFHTTSAIEAATEAINYKSAMTPERIEAMNAEAPVPQETQREVAKIISLEERLRASRETEHDRFQRYIEFRQRKFEGLTVDELAWCRRYEESNECQGQMMVYKSCYESDENAG